MEGHRDSCRGPAVFFRLGALRPGDNVDVRLADGITAVFRVTGVRRYVKSNFPAKTVYGPTDYAALRLITCSCAFDYTTGPYLSSTVVFASLTSSRRGHEVRAWPWLGSGSHGGTSGWRAGHSRRRLDPVNTTSEAGLVDPGQDLSCGVPASDPMAGPREARGRRGPSWSCGSWPRAPETGRPGCQPCPALTLPR